ncbi:hypothetical protein D3C71_1317370 [compost metagenome]
MRKIVRYDIEGVPCWTNGPCTLTEIYFKSHFPTPTCPICHIEFKSGDETMLMQSNHVLFPNIRVHLACCSGEETIRYLIRDYAEYLSMKERYKYWL